MDVTAVGQAEEENVYKFICHKQGDKTMDGCKDLHCWYGRHHRISQTVGLLSKQLSRNKSMPFMSVWTKMVSVLTHLKKRLPTTD